MAFEIGRGQNEKKREPLKIDFEYLDRIRELVEVPLVLPGGAAVADPDMQKAVAGGIAKYNIADKGYQAFLNGLETALKNLREEIAPGKLVLFPSRVRRSGVKAAKMEIRSQIRFLGATGKADSRQEQRKNDRQIPQTF